MTIKLIRATPTTDFDAIREVYYQSWQATYANQLPATYLAQLNRQQWHPETRWQTTWLAVTANGEIVGVCSYGAARNSDYTGWGEVYSIYLLPQYQRQRIGERLMKAAMRDLTTQYEHYYLAVLETNVDAQCFYEKLGLKRSERRYQQAIPGGVLSTMTYEKK